MTHTAVDTRREASSPTSEHEGSPLTSAHARLPAAAMPTHGVKVKLPKISLPHFHGDPVKWTSFWDAYKSAIHSNLELSEVDKFNYLRSLLDRSALDAIAGLTLSSANYQQAIEILHKRFGNKQVIITARERANPNLSREKPNHTPALFSGSSTNPQCAYCRQSHPSMSCASVTKPADRRNILKTSGRCFNCLRRGHIVRNCKSSSKCQKCKKHHTSICDDGQSQTPSLPSTGDSGLNPNATPFPSTPTTSTLCSDNVQSVFLQTARAVIHRVSDPNVSLDVRLILDGGSQKSYVSQRVCDTLDLEVVGKQPLSIATFGSDRGCSRVCPVVTVGLCLRGYPSMPLSLYVMPTICEPLVGQPILACIAQHPHLTGLELADSSGDGSPLPVDLLIGSDYYWELVTGSVCRGTGGPIAIHTKLGWVLSGPASSDKPDQCAMNLSITHVLHAETHPTE